VFRAGTYSAATAARSRNADGHSSGAVAALRRAGTVERRRLRSGAPAHDFTTEERRRGAQRTNEIKRERAASREAKAEPLDLAEKLYMLEADKMLLRTGKLTTTITAPSQAPSGEKRFHCRH
jgi:hypothetical protein